MSDCTCPRGRVPQVQGHIASCPQNYGAHLRVVEPTMKADNVEGASFGKKVSPSSLLANLMSKAAAGEVELLITIAVLSNGELRVGYTSGNGLMLVGLMRAGEEELFKSLSAARPTDKDKA